MAVLIPVILLILHVLLVPGVVHPPEVPVPSGHQLSLYVCVLGNLDPWLLGPGVHQHLLLATQVTKHLNYVMFIMDSPVHREESGSDVPAPGHEQGTPGSSGAILFRK